MDFNEFDIEVGLDHFREQINLAERNLRVYRCPVAYLESKKNK